jgi:hypothetical protein
MMPLTNPPRLLALKPANIPTFLTSKSRWALWQAVWSEKRQKYDKIPKHPKGYGISTTHTAKWCSYETALAALPTNPTFAGVGYLMTGADGLVGIDMDKCVVDGVIASWAQEIVNQVGSYTEISPSGTGLRIFTEGNIDFDWTNHAVGIEVYAGHTARFLTVTGQHIAGTPQTVNRARFGLLDALATQHAKSRESATVISMSMPDILSDLALPSPSELDLPFKVKDYLEDGTPPASDRSLSLLVTSIALHKAGLDTSQVYSMLANNEYTMEAALEKRGHDMERALLYLWVHHAQKGGEKVTASSIATLADFEDVSEKPQPTVLDDFEDVSNKKIAPPAKRFEFIQVMDYIKNQVPLKWAIKNVLPLAEVGALYGESTAGKSFFALDMAMAIAIGKPWRGHAVQQGTVTYICGEGAQGFALRTEAYVEFHGDVAPDTPFHILGKAPNLLEKADVKELISSINAHAPVSLVIVDTLAQSTPGADENSSEGMGRALAHCKTIHEATGAMVLLIAHAGKDTSRGIRGWSGIKGALDVEICVSRSGEKRVGTITKMKDGTGEGVQYGFSLDTVVVRTDPNDGSDLTSCVLKDGAAPVNVGGRKTEASIWKQAIMDCFTNLIDLTGSATPDQIIDAAVDTVARDTNAPKDRRRERLKRAMGVLIDTGFLALNSENEVSATDAK